jgi:hypothetical protein
MRKLACSLVSLLAAAVLVVACGGSDDKPGDLGPGSETPPIFDGGDTGPGYETIQPLDGSPDGVPPTDCDKTTLGNYAYYKSCAADTDCTAGEQCDTTVGFCFKACTTDAECTGGQVCITDPTSGAGICDACGTVNEILTMGEDEDGSIWGICTCGCTPDDTSSPLSNEDTCPDLNNNVCSQPIAISGGTCATDADCANYGTGFICQDGKCQGDKSYCVHKCKPTLGTNACNGDLACEWDSTFDVYEPICATRGCTDNDQCPVTTGVMCDPKKGLGSDSPNPDCGPGTCLLFTYKNQTCTTDADCTSKWPNFVCVDLGSAGSPAKYCIYKEGLCAKPGKCDTASGLCDKKPAGLFKATAKVGDPCKGDTDCGETMDCSFEMDMAKLGYKKKGEACAADEECCSYNCEQGTCGAGGLCTVRNRNGYCTVYGCEMASTLTIKACPANSECFIFIGGGGACERTCSLTDPTPSTSCRGGTADLVGDYECRDWSNFTLASGGTLTKGPVCDFVHFGCDIYADYWKTDCSFVGDSNGNPTNMKCRGYDNQPSANQKDPDGLCLDDTAAGAGVRNPLP